MMKKSETAKSPDGPKRITLERTLRASVEDVWKLWTTKAGLESWWGPDGFTTEVKKLDFRAGGTFEYSMTATGAAQIEGMKAAGLPLTSTVRGTYREVAPRQRFAYTTVVDFIARVAPYEVGARVEIHVEPQGVRLVVIEDPLHNAEWTRMSVMGMNSSLDKLARLLEERRVNDQAVRSAEE